MDIVFNCPNCDQELAVDSSGAGTSIECPSCHETITIPAAPRGAESGRAAAEPRGQPHLDFRRRQGGDAPQGASVRQAPAPLIAKPKPPLEAVVRGAGKKIRSHTIKHGACIESGHDKFDEVVTKFLNEVGEPNIIAIHTVSYSFLDIGTQKLLNDYGLLVIYRG